MASSGFVIFKAAQQPSPDPAVVPRPAKVTPSATPSTPPAGPPPGSLNVKEYGAVGNGTRNDTRAVQSALDAAKSGGTIWFPPGTYVLAGLDGTGRSGLSLRGVRGKSILLYKTAPKASMIVWNQATTPSTNDADLTFEGLTFKGAPGVSELQYLLSLSAVDDVTITNCDFLQFQGDGIYLGRTEIGGADTGVQNRRVKITNCLFDGVDYTNRNAISIITGDNVLITGNTFTRCSHPTMPGAIDIEPNVWDVSAIIRDIRIVDNTFVAVGGSNGSVSVALVPPTFSIQPARIQIEGNTFTGSKMPDVYLLWAGHSATSQDPRTTINVTGNTHGPGDGGSTVTAISLDGLRGVNVEGNTITGRHGGAIAAGMSYAVRDLTIRQNTMTDSGAGTHQVITLKHAMNCVIEGNSATLTTARASHFVYFDEGGASNGVSVTDNTLRGITHAATVDEAHANDLNL